MAKLNRSAFVIFMTLALFVAACNGYYALAADKVASTSASGSKPITMGAMLDNFEYAAPLNLWSLPTGTFSSSTSVPPPSDAICTASYTNASGVPYGGSGYSLKLDYNVNLANCYAGYSSQLGSQNLSSPTAYTAISFWVKGATGGEFFKIQLKDASGTSAGLYINDYLDGGVTQSWQKVTIPFHNFGNISNFSSMSEFVIVFENAQCGINGSPTSGTVYIDNIAFETTPISMVRIDHFGDKIGTCAMGGNMGTMSDYGGTISYAFSNTANEYSDYPCGLKINYNVSSNVNSWAGVWSLFGGAADGWGAVPHNFSAYNYLYLRVRSVAGGNPLIMRIELQDSVGSKVVRINSIATGWYYWRLALSSFVNPNTGVANLNKATIKQLNIVFESSKIGTEGGSKVGTVYIDDIQFEQ